MNKLFYVLPLISALMSSVQAQTTYNPLAETKQVIWGQGFGKNLLTRLPAEAEKTVPEVVWKQSLCPSGLQVRFRSNANSITVNYTIDNKYTNNKWFSEIGGSGVDLYARKPDGKFYWCYPSKKTVGESFEYSQINPNDENYQVSGYEYCLYLPLFVTPKSLTITVNEGATFEFIPVPREKKPIVIYGTSIVHGAVCSRPGNSWANIVSRNFFDIPVVNLGFSGVGRVEPEVISVFNQIDAELFILDCLPNMSNNQMLDNIETRYTSAVDSIRKYHPKTPILLTEHIGYANMEMDNARKVLIVESNKHLRNVYDRFMKKGYKNLYYMTREELNLNMSTDIGDYIHPNDKGMYRYAKVYTAKIKKILKIK